MSGRGRADAVQTAIVGALRGIPGVSVHVLSHYPKQLDILVGFRGRTYWYEIKGSPREALTGAERNILEHWTGHAKVVYGLADILRDLGILKDEAVEGK